MTKFQVRVTRTVVQHQWIEVEVADDLSSREKEIVAGDLALAKAGDYDFSGTEKDAEYDVDEVQEQNG